MSITKQLIAIDTLFEQCELIQLVEKHFDEETVKIGIDDLKLGIIDIIENKINSSHIHQYIDIFRYIRPGKVISAARVKDTENLIKMCVCTALGKKTIVTNLGSDFKPEDFVEKTFMFIMNMPPIKMQGILSEVMIIASSTLYLDDKTNQWIDKPILMPINIPINAIIL